MTRRELNLAIFEGKAEGVLWQPVLDTWISYHMREGSMPERFRGMSSVEIHDALRCSIRYAASAETNAIEQYEARDDLVRITEEHPKHTVLRVRTPVGEIRTVYRDIWRNGRKVNSRIEEYPVKTVEDLRVATFLVEREQYRAEVEGFERAAGVVGERGAPTVFLQSAGFTNLIKWWCGLENTFYLLYDHPAAVEEHLEACDRRDDRMLDEALKMPCRIFSLGDHANNEFTPPPILKKYMLPRWRRIAERVHAAGRFIQTHWDGTARTILPHVRETHMDGVEALTPAPMGDITLEQIKEAVGEDMVVLDLLPAIDFLPYRPVKELLEFARRVIDMFAPRLILGISDEISEVGEIEKVEAVSELVDEICGLPE